MCHCPAIDPWPLVETQLSDTGHYIAPQNSLVIIRFHDTIHTVKASSVRSSKATPKHLWTSTMFDCVLFFEGLISFSVNSAMMSFTKKLYFCLVCPQFVLTEGLLFCHIRFGKLQSCFFMPLCQQWCLPGSPTIAPLFIQMATDSASWQLYPVSADQFEFVGKLIRVLYPPSNNPSFKFFINFAFPSTSREVNYSAMGCTSIDDIVHSGHRNIKISGDGLVALRLSMFFSLKIHRQLTLSTSFFSPCSVWCRTQRLSQLFSILTGCKCDYYIAHICYSPQVCLSTNYRSITCLKSSYFYNFDKAPIILSNPF